jgi:hypothetical protein
VCTCYLKMLMYMPVSQVVSEQGEGNAYMHTSLHSMPLSPAICCCP